MGKVDVFILTTTDKKLDYNFKTPSSRKAHIAAALEKEIRTEVFLIKDEE